MKDTVHGVAKSWTRLSNFTFTFLSLYVKCSGGYKRNEKVSLTS